MAVMDAAFFEAPAEGRPPPPGPQGRRYGEPHGPLINAPWAAAMVASLIVVGYVIQSQFPPAAAAQALAFAPALLGQGGEGRLVSYIFVHGSWAHALMNAAFALAFGAPVARWFGERAMGALLFFLFYLLCGVLGALAYAALHPASTLPVVGASGAVSGLMGAAARLIAGHGRLGPILSRPVLALGGGWLVINLILAVAGGALIPGAGGAGVAWEIHVASFVIGVLAISPFAWLLRRA